MKTYWLTVAGLVPLFAAVIIAVNFLQSPLSTFSFSAAKRPFICLKRAKNNYLPVPQFTAKFL
ncbi:MAG: hypothetical protein AMJ43_11350 [Coxiella sp. DG_40]|nr:MAG: hypothetical protein AMJ43_11350 [Coxiella sp. DG_40]